MPRRRPSSSASGPESPIRQQDESAVDYVQRCTEDRVLLPSHSLMRLAAGGRVELRDTEMLFEGQYRIADDRLDHAWIRQLRRDAREVLSGRWVDQHLPATSTEHHPPRRHRNHHYEGDEPPRDIRTTPLFRRTGIPFKTRTLGPMLMC